MRVTEEAVVSSGSRVKRVLIWAMSKWTKYIVTFNEEEDEDILVEEGPQIERARCFTGTHATVRFTKETFVTKRIPREAFFDLGDVKVENVIVTFSEQEDEDTVVDVGPQIERGTVFRRDTCRSRNFRDKRFPREACFDLGDVKVESVIVAFREEEEEDIRVEEEPRISRGTVFLRDACDRKIFQRNICDKRLPRDLGDAKVLKHCALQRRGG